MSQTDKVGAALAALKEVEDAIFRSTGTAFMAGESTAKASDRHVIYRTLCDAGNKVAWAHGELYDALNAPRSAERALDLQGMARAALGPEQANSATAAAKADSAPASATSAQWIGCQQCDPQFDCYNGEHACIRWRTGGKSGGRGSHG